MIRNSIFPEELTLADESVIIINRPLLENIIYIFKQEGQASLICWQNPIHEQVYRT